MKFTELSTDVQESVLGKFSQWAAEEWTASDSVYPMLVEAMGYLGYAIDGNKDGNGFSYELGYGQGDYFALSGIWQAEDMNVAKLKDEFPEVDPKGEPTCWVKLHEIANEMMAVYIKYPQGWIDIRHDPRRNGEMYLMGYANGGDRDQTDELSFEDMKPFIDLTKRLCAWAFEYLRDEYEYQTSGDVALQSIEDNDYDFDEHGAIVTQPRTPTAPPPLRSGP